MAPRQAATGVLLLLITATAFGGVTVASTQDQLIELQNKIVVIESYRTVTTGTLSVGNPENTLWWVTKIRFGVTLQEAGFNLDQVIDIEYLPQPDPRGRRAIITIQR